MVEEFLRAPAVTPAASLWGVCCCLNAKTSACFCQGQKCRKHCSRVQERTQPHGWTRNVRPVACKLRSPGSLAHQSLSVLSGASARPHHPPPRFRRRLTASWRPVRQARTLSQCNHAGQFPTWLQCTWRNVPACFSPST